MGGKMGSNFFEIPNDWYSDFNKSFMNNSITNMPMEVAPNDLTNPKEAFIRGNLFNNLYSPYKSYKYRELKASSEKNNLLLNILIYHFALTDLALYLDNYPSDKNMLNVYNNYLNNKKRLVADYEKMYGPLTLTGDNLGYNDWHWSSSPWPWEVGI